MKECRLTGKKKRHMKAGTYRELPREKLKTEAKHENPLQLFGDMALAPTLANREY